MPATTRIRLAAVLAALIALGTACGGATEEAAADPHAGHGGGAVDPLRPVAGDPVELGPEEDLYAVPDPLPAGPHGTLLRYEEVVPGPVPTARTYRILYLGQTLTGEPTAISGTVLVPTAGAPAGGRSVVGVGPESTGLANVCAPSRDRSGEVTLLGPYVEAGHLVVMTDGEGVGTPGRHPYLVGASAGHSLLDAVRAAGELPGAGAGDHVGLAGSAEGGHAALWADRLAAAWAPELHVVGTVAGAPTTDLGAVVERPGDAPRPGLVPAIVAGLAAASRYVDPSTYLTDAGRDALELVETHCRDEVDAALAGVDVADLVRPDGPVTASWTAAAAANDPVIDPADDSVRVLPAADPVGVHAEAATWLTTRLADEG
jgi:hypothetical protein